MDEGLQEALPPVISLGFHGIPGFFDQPRQTVPDHHFPVIGTVPGFMDEGVIGIVGVRQILLVNDLFCIGQLPNDRASGNEIIVFQRHGYSVEHGGKKSGKTRRLRRLCMLVFDIIGDKNPFRVCCQHGPLRQYFDSLIDVALHSIHSHAPFVKNY